ncbi:MAG TPA: ROK family protein [Bacillota bacterium]|nr:ROK family protein [Bacillota bacterium]
MPAMTVPPDDGRLALAIDLGASHLSVGLVDGAGKLYHPRALDLTGPADPAKVLFRVIAAGRRLLTERGNEVGPVVGVGIGVAGLVDPRARRVLSAGNLGWTDIDVGMVLEQGLGLPVSADNDARLATLAEALYGAGRGSANLLGVWVGTGIGGGIILGGRVIRGASGTAGEIGHLPLVEAGSECTCGNRGCLETLAAGPALAAAGREALARARRSGARSALRELCGDDPASVSCRLLAVAADQGDPDACGIFTRAGTHLGIALAGAVNLLNPEKIVVGGGVAGAGEHLLGPARGELAKRVLRAPGAAVSVVPAQFRETGVLVGAGALVLGYY